MELSDEDIGIVNELNAEGDLICNLYEEIKSMGYEAFKNGQVYISIDYDENE